MTVPYTQMVQILAFENPVLEETQAEAEAEAVPGAEEDEVEKED